MPAPVKSASTFSPQRPARVGVLGASGTTGVELVQLLAQHPAATLAWATSREHAGKSLREADPAAQPVQLTHPDDADLGAIDIALTAVPHGTAPPLVNRLVAAGVKVVDLSGDHRLHDPALHQEVYGSERDAKIAGEAAYGLTERAREAVKSASLVANPGCYPTCVGLALAPLAAAGLLGDAVMIDAKSGVSGAGRKATPTTHFCAVADDVRPYKLGRGHRHAPEIDQVIADAASEARPPVVFCPHVVPFERGMLATIFLPGAQVGAGDALAALAAAYEGEPLVEILPDGQAARIRAVARTPRAQIGVHDGGGALVLTSAIDNLMKGAASQAVQNMNLMLGLEETLGLLPTPAGAFSSEEAA